MPTEKPEFMSPERDNSFDVIVRVNVFGKPDQCEANTLRTLERILGEAFPDASVVKVRRGARQS